MQLKALLENKGRDLVTIEEHATICEAGKRMVEHNIGSLLVLNDQEMILGILTERDLLRLCPEKYGEMNTLCVKDIMTTDVIVGNIDDTVEMAENLMTKNRIRHLPVLDNGRISGLISIGDIVKAQLQDIEVENKYLKDYISGNYTG